MIPFRFRQAARAAVGGLAVALLVTSGCGPSDDRVKIPTVPVTGKLMIDGKPFGPAKLLLTPTTTDGSIPAVFGTAAEDGTYALFTYSRFDEEPDGAPPGTYQVGFQLDAMNPGRGMPVLKKGADRVTIPESSDEVALDINVESTGKEAGVMQGGKLPASPNAPGRLNMGRPPGMTPPGR